VIGCIQPNLVLSVVWLLAQLVVLICGSDSRKLLLVVPTENHARGCGRGKSLA